MTKQILTAFIVMCASVVYGQQIQVGNAVTVNPSKISEKISKIDTKTLKKRIFEHSDLTELDTYSVGKYPMMLNAGDAKVTSDYLQVLKLDMDHANLVSNPAYQYSVIKKFGNFKALIIEVEEKNSKKGYINFYCVNNTDEKCMNGHLEYPVEDRLDATKVLDEFLNNTNFK